MHRSITGRKTTITRTLAPEPARPIIDKNGRFYGYRVITSIWRASRLTLACFITRVNKAELFLASRSLSAKTVRVGFGTTGHNSRVYFVSCGTPKSAAEVDVLNQNYRNSFLYTCSATRSALITVGANLTNVLIAAK